MARCKQTKAERQADMRIDSAANVRARQPKQARLSPHERAERAGYRIKENKYTATNNGFYFLRPGETRDDAPKTYRTEIEAWHAAIADLESE